MIYNIMVINVIDIVNMAMMESEFSLSTANSL